MTIGPCCTASPSHTYSPNLRSVLATLAGRECLAPQNGTASARACAQAIASTPTSTERTTWMDSTARHLESTSCYVLLLQVALSSDTACETHSRRGGSANVPVG